MNITFRPLMRARFLSYTAFIIVFLGLMSAFAPFVTDMYLPALPALLDVFSTSMPMIQLGLTASMVGLAVGQVFFGPLSDKYGRRPIMIVSLVVYAVATALCIFAPDINFFLVMRLLQGLGGAGGIVLSRSVATDLYAGRQLAKMMAIIGAVNGLAPVTAPVIGGFVGALAGWRAIFVVLLGFGLCLLAMSCIFRESLPAGPRRSAALADSFKGYVRLFRRRDFSGYVLAFAFSQGVLFSYIAATPFIIQNVFRLDEMTFSVVFGVNALAIGLGSAASMKFSSLRRASVVGCVGMTVAAAGMFAASVAGLGFWGYELTAWTMLFTMGLVFTGASTMAMNAGRDYVGASSASIGASGFLIGGLVSPLAGLGDIMLTCPALCALCGIIATVALRFSRSAAIG